MDNGETELGLDKKPPALAVIWDEQQQTVHLQFDPLVFRNWDFVKACLDMAVEKAADERRLCMMRAMQQREQQKALDREITKRMRIN